MDEGTQADTQVVDAETTQVVTDTMENGTTTQEEVNENESSGNETDSTDDQGDSDVQSNDDSSDNSDTLDAEDDDEDAMVPLAKLRKVRNEAKNLRERLKASESRVSELEANTAVSQADADVMVERDVLKAQVESLTNAARETVLKAEVAALAQEAGAVEPDALLKLLGDVVWEDEKPTNVKALVADLKKTYPRMFSQPVGNGNGGNRNERGGNLEGRSSTDLLTEAYRNN